MVIFHGYVKLPEGTQTVQTVAKSKAPTAWVLATSYMAQWSHRSQHLTLSATGKLCTEICWYHLRTMQEEGRHGPAQHQYSPSEFSTNLSFNEFLRELTYHIRVSNI